MVEHRAEMNIAAVLLFHNEQAPSADIGKPRFGTDFKRPPQYFIGNERRVKKVVAFKRTAYAALCALPAGKYRKHGCHLPYAARQTPFVSALSCQFPTFYYISFTRYCQQIFIGHKYYFKMVTIDRDFWTFQQPIENSGAK
jgi:hypothetical protein